MENSKVYVGGLGEDGRVSQDALEHAFKEFGSIRSVWVATNPPGFGFVEYEDSRDADDAVRKMDGQELEGCSLRVAIARPKRGGGGGRGGYSGGGGGFGGGRGGGSCYNCGEPGHFSRECPNSGGGGGGGYRGGGGGYGGGGYGGGGGGYGGGGGGYGGGGYGGGGYSRGY